MITYVCNKCKKAIPFDDIEAIEVLPIKSKLLFSEEEHETLDSTDYEYKEFKGMTKSIHLCGECKGGFYDYI